MTLLDLAQNDGINLKRVSSTNGGEYAGPCPSCGGDDRFHVWPEQGNGGRYWCRGCDSKGDSIQYLRDFRKLSYREACHLLDREPKRMDQPLNRGRRNRKPDNRKPSETWQAKVAPLPGDQWAQRAGQFLAWTEQQLWTTDQGKGAIEWLHGRGLADDTIKRFRLGWNSQKWFPSRSAFGLPEVIKENGKRKKLWLPLGLVIPKVINGHVLRIRIRQPEGDPKYCLLSGSETGPLIIPGGPGCVVVESELDAILLHQEGGDLATMIALGSDTIRPDQATAVILDQTEVILLSLDSDGPGAKEAWQWWPRHYPKSKRWPCIGGKDPSEAKPNGLDLRAWVMAGLLPPDGVNLDEQGAGTQGGGDASGKDHPVTFDKNDPASWATLAATGKTDLDVIDSDRALFLFALDKLRQTPEADRGEVWEKFGPYWKKRLDPAAFSLIRTWQESGHIPLGESCGPSSTMEEPKAEEWKSPYPYSCRDCFHAGAGCQRHERIEHGLQCLHDCTPLLGKGAAP